MYEPPKSRYSKNLRTGPGMTAFKLFQERSAKEHSSRWYGSPSASRRKWTSSTDTEPRQGPLGKLSLNPGGLLRRSVPELSARRGATLRYRQLSATKVETLQPVEAVVEGLLGHLQQTIQSRLQ